MRTPNSIAVFSAFITIFILIAAPTAQKPAQPSRPSEPPLTSEAARRVEGGAALYRKKGCYECHVEEAQGGPQGPRLGPNPIPLPRFTTYVRNPTGDMPPYTERVLSNQELADIYAFLQTRPQPKPVATNPLLTP